MLAAIENLSDTALELSSEELRTVLNASLLSGTEDRGAAWDGPVGPFAALSSSTLDELPIHETAGGGRSSVGDSGDNIEIPVVPVEPGMVLVNFRWPAALGGSTVAVVGSFNNWTTPLVLEKSHVSGDLCVRYLVHSVEATDSCPGSLFLI